jgi:hypothetical protein
MPPPTKKSPTEVGRASPWRNERGKGGNGRAYLSEINARHEGVCKHRSGSLDQDSSW